MLTQDHREDARRAGVSMQWDLKIPLRDGTQLSAIVYRPKECGKPAPCIVTKTPYTSQAWHHFAVEFAVHGFPFVAVDCRGRGNSDGMFRPFIQEGNDGYDVVEWVARQPFCDGRVAMWGGSYGGYDQWVTASRHPPHLTTIAPVASVYPGIDFPMRNNISMPYVMQWLTFVSGRTSQSKMFFESQGFWNAGFREWYESGKPFRELDSMLGNPSPVFQEWITHPKQDAYWDSYNPTAAELAEISMPVLTITGIYDTGQPGAIKHYRRHLESAPPESAGLHYLVIGPWDHAGTRIPMPEFGGIRIGLPGLVDVTALHVEWYRWTLLGGARPEFLKKRVAYYVMGAERWAYADSLDAVTARTEHLYLDSAGSAHDVFRSGLLLQTTASESKADQYIYDPRDLGLAALESTVDPGNWADQRLVYAASGRHLVYHSAPFDADLEICGFFSLCLWLSVDQPDTDVRASVYEIALDGSSILLSADSMRARYRTSPRVETLIADPQPARYEFTQFTFVARTITKRHRLRLVIGPVDSIYSERNCNTGGVVADERPNESRRVTVKLHHDSLHPSALIVPLGASDSASDRGAAFTSAEREVRRDVA
jgi:uncharacterized protein